MEMFPADQDQLATKADIGRLDGRMDQLDGRMDRLDKRMEKFEDRLWDFHQALHAHARTNLIATVSSLTGLTAIFSMIVLFFA